MPAKEPAVLPGRQDQSGTDSQSPRNVDKSTDVSSNLRAPRSADETSIAAPGKTPRVNGTNPRMVAAARFILSGANLKSALTRAGYAESTAAKPKANGLTVERCLAELAKLDPSGDAITLVREARRVALRAIRGLGTLSEAKLLEGRSLGAVAKLWDTAERFHGAGAEAPKPPAAKGFRERAGEMMLVLAEMQRRGIIPQGSHRVVDISPRSEGVDEVPQPVAVIDDTPGPAVE